MVVNRVTWQCFFISSAISSSNLSLSLVLSLVTQYKDHPAVIGTAGNSGLTVRSLSDFCMHVEQYISKTTVKSHMGVL